MTADIGIASFTPPAAPLAMPTQDLLEHPRACRAGDLISTALARGLTFGGALALTGAAAWQMYLTLPFGSASALPWLGVLLWSLLALFTLTFGWVALSATAAVAGLCTKGRTLRAAADAPLQGKTALLMPIYNEDASSACAALAAMGEDLHRLGLQNHFDIFVLSDTREPGIASVEMAAVQRLRKHLSGVIPVWYRRREQNTERKAGNVRDFVNRWGSAYAYMVVLDADSLMAGETLASLVREMDAAPSTGILQTLPRLYNGQTLYARLQQFSAGAYGGIFARGLSAWQGSDGNYWGHNAIIRTRAFAASAGLPALSGRRPFGGEIRSHDFVEAALIRRAGWTVSMLPDLPGSWEECPPTLLDAATRDRRWAQGNIQHLAVVSTRGLRWPSRAHLLMGVMNYLTSPLWLVLVALGLVLSLSSATPAFDSERMIGLFIATMGLLLLPKLLGLARGIRKPGFVPSAILELFFSILHAPIFMLIHTRQLWEIARGQDSGWSAQQRQSAGLPWRQLAVRHGVHTALGVSVMVLLLSLSSALLYWMLPMIVGLILAIPLSALSRSRAAGQWLAQRGLLVGEEDLAPPGIIQRRRALVKHMAGRGDPPAVRSSGEGCRPCATYGGKRPQYGPLPAHSEQ